MSPNWLIDYYVKINEQKSVIEKYALVISHTNITIDWRLMFATENNTIKLSNIIYKTCKICATVGCKKKRELSE
jgi:hypothetical protein